MTCESTFTLDDLCTRAALALSIDYDGAPNDRVREVPDRRTVRYYTTLGLVDRPSVRGRTAMYGPRQLMQLVAIKRLQSRGLSLHEIQRQLPALSDEELKALANIAGVDDSPSPQPPPRPREFWKQPPPPPAAPATLQAVPLGENIMLLVPLRRAPDAGDLAALRLTAAPLLRLLEVRRLIDEP